MSLLLVDGHNFLFRAYSVPFSFSSASGTPLHVTTTFLSQMRRAASAVSAQEIIVVFDAPGATSNHQLSEDYKANREYDYAEDDSPFLHLPIIKNCLDLLEISWHEQPGTEADDIIASLATQHNSRAFIASTDTDFLQLISEQIQIIKLLSGQSHVILDEAHVLDKYGLPPQQFVELKSWVGDTADNIKGIAGIGWKRGLKILKGELHRELTQEEQQVLELNRSLITLNRDLDVTISHSNSARLLELSNQEIFAACEL